VIRARLRISVERGSDKRRIVTEAIDNIDIARHPSDALLRVDSDAMKIVPRSLSIGVTDVRRRFLSLVKTRVGTRLRHTR